MKITRYKIKVRTVGDIRRFTRASVRSITRELRLLWEEFGAARSIEIEVAA